MLGPFGCPLSPHSYPHLGGSYGKISQDLAPSAARRRQPRGRARGGTAGRGWDAHGVRDCRALQKASPKAAAFYTFGRGVILHFAAPLLLQIALGSVDLDAVGGGFAAANRIEIYRSKSNL